VANGKAKDIHQRPAAAGRQWTGQFSHPSPPVHPRIRSRAHQLIDLGRDRQLPAGEVVDLFWHGSAGLTGPKQDPRATSSFHREEAIYSPPARRGHPAEGRCKPSLRNAIKGTGSAKVTRFNGAR
jgi:hypothetical protein